MPTVAGDALAVLVDLADRARDAGAVVTAAGDLFDGPRPDAAQVAALRRAFEDVTVVYVLGNHDGGQDWPTAMGNNWVCVDAAPVEVAGVTYGGLSYRDDLADFRRALEGLRAAPAAVGLYHQTWHDLAPRPGRFPVRDLPAHAIAVLGDVHVRRAWAPAVGPAYAVSPGPACPQSVAELGEGGFAYAEYRTGRVEAVPLPRRPVARVRCGDAAGTPPTEVLELVAAAAPRPDLPPALRVPLLVVDWVGPGDPPPAWAAAADPERVVLWVRRAVPPVPVAGAAVLPAAGLEAAVRARLAGDPAAERAALAVLRAAADGPAAAARAVRAAAESFLTEYDRGRPETPPA